MIIPVEVFSSAHPLGVISAVQGIFIKLFNPKSTGLFPPGAALGGCFHPPFVRLDPDILES